MTAVERFWARVVSGPDGCWLWTGRPNHEGYGRFGVDYRVVMAHRFSYELHIGPIPEGLVLDHVCHNRAAEAGTCAGGRHCLHRRCVNPAHLEAVTDNENRRRSPHMGRNGAEGQTHCLRGHEFDDANTRIDRDGGRTCRRCSAIRVRAYLLRKKAS